MGWEDEVEYMLEGIASSLKLGYQKTKAASGNVYNLYYKNNIKHEVIKFSNFMDLNKLQKIKKDGITSLLIPFAFRTHNINKETIKDIVSYIKKQAENKRLENETFAIIIKNQ